ncbi:type VII toxin-antitoxin system MntA family adenylyltransferase antitoxin [Motilimonas eburnea]|uniref:type VII toxin-antitoxin system MntA family adenylyltransferase antitoxin n=1 Tax=Motilimonas eburnea TaxID=1737488 RepID=UPI001E541B25|nr:nucleotidyltransferase domain-containing protein [Motilimonas eburnea]MCE2573597.1 nucleotidyltransferase domain-containing protein [Motilimonas eburnea]
MALKSLLADPVINAVATLAASHSDVAVLWLYGSRATNRAHAQSDYDLAIAFNNFKLSHFDKYIRPNELALQWSEQLGLPSDKLSIVDINQVPIYLAYSIVDSGTIIYQEDSSRAYHEQDRIYSMYEYQKRVASYD